MYGEAIRWVLDQLERAGINAAADPADLNTPGVWVTPASSTADRMAPRVGVVTLTLYLVTGNTGGLDDVDALDQLHDQVNAAGVVVRDTEAVTVTLPNHSTAGLPALRTTTTLQHTPGE